MTGQHGDGVGPLLLVPLLVFWVYLAAALRRREPGRGGWSHWRTASFGAGAALLAVAAVLPGHDLVGHMWRHLLVGMLAPLGLVLGAPGTLALRTVRRDVGRVALRVLRHPVPRMAAHPVTGLLLTAGGLYLLHLTPLYRATLAHPGLHGLVLLHFLASGYLFTWAIAGPDPGPHRSGVPLRLVVLGLSVAAHATLAQLMYAGLVDTAAPVAQLRAAATLMYYGGDLAEILLALALLVTWRPVARRARSEPTPSPA
ncbi:cytochrome c oxidase assembly protein [Micromonospora purpureochromogenes]|uniref:Membrane protein n=1 Tax=Micromonospora purpureochromogenes TaxID=47872 RepID=A0ABX2RT63_9ACTN|nr:cytochrome c oxidase assembly protein [Micromonospora purpureochromogenes]NYF58434.1 putative membrane protein [Micromonospora purpureochromogenes]